MDKKTGIASSPPHPQWQISRDLPLCNIRLTRLIESSSSSPEKSRLLAVSAPHSSHWLNALPIPSLGLKMDNSSFRIACPLRLGSPLCHPHQCICCTWVDSSGVHGLSCKKSAGRFSRHTHVNNLIKRALESAPCSYYFGTARCIAHRWEKTRWNDHFSLENGKVHGMGLYVQRHLCPKSP